MPLHYVGAVDVVAVAGTDPPPQDLSELVAHWPEPEQAAIAVTTPDTIVGATGDLGRASRVASISKVVVGLAAMVAVEEGTITLDEPAGPDGATVRHLLAHASGLAFDEHRVLAPVGQRRIYSNAGIEQFADHLAARAGMPFHAYQHEAVIEPLAMSSTVLQGSPAHGVHAAVADLVRLARELLAPTLVHPSSLREATTVQFPGLPGVVPGFGSFAPNDWGLAMEIRGAKQPHWTAPGNAGATFGHFGGSGSYLWVDPTLGLACAAISGTEYGPWANEAWPRTNQAILDRFA